MVSQSFREISFKLPNFHKKNFICKKIQGNFSGEMETGIFVSKQTEKICLAQMHDTAWWIQ